MSSRQPTMALSCRNIKYHVALDTLRTATDTIREPRMSTGSHWKPSQAGVLIATTAVLRLASPYLLTKRRILLELIFLSSCVLSVMLFIFLIRVVISVFFFLIRHRVPLPLGWEAGAIASVFLSQALVVDAEAVATCDKVREECLQQQQNPRGPSIQQKDPECPQQQQQPCEECLLSKQQPRGLIKEFMSSCRDEQPGVLNRKSR